MAVLYLIVDSFLPNAKQGLSKKEVEQEIIIHDLKQENILLEKQNNQNQVKLNRFLNEKSKIDSITNGYNKPQIDSFYTNYFKR